MQVSMVDVECSFFAALTLSCTYYYIFDKGIKQRRACFYPVLETCYDAAEHEKVLRENETKLSFFLLYECSAVA